MFAQQLNQMRIDLSITPRAPLLIRSGRKGADPTRPELECVRTAWGGTSSVYVPGSSLKGVMRSHAERLLLSEDVKITPTFTKSSEFNQKSEGDRVYRGTSPLGRTFGNLNLKGHVAVSDLLPGAFEKEEFERERQIEMANMVEQRNGVAIDRLLGSALTRALFDQEVVVQGRFDGHIVLRNVQLYQLALVLLVLRDLDEGYVQIGSSTTRGNGWVRAEVRSLTIETRRGRGESGLLCGVGEMRRAEDPYDLFQGDSVKLPAGVDSQNVAVWERLIVSGEQTSALLEALVEGPWTSFLKQAKRQKWAA